MKKYEYKVQIHSGGKTDWILSHDSFNNDILAKVWARRYRGVYPSAKTRIVRRPLEWEVVE